MVTWALSFTVAAPDTSDNACWLAFYSLITLHNVHYQYLISDLENLLTSRNCRTLSLSRLVATVPTSTAETEKLISLRLFQHHLFYSTGKTRKTVHPRARNS